MLAVAKRPLAYYGYRALQRSGVYKRARSRVYQAAGGFARKAVSWAARRAASRIQTAWRRRKGLNAKVPRKVKGGSNAPALVPSGVTELALAHNQLYKGSIKDLVRTATGFDATQRNFVDITSVKILGNCKNEDTQTPIWLHIALVTKKYGFSDIEGLLVNFYTDSITPDADADCIDFDDENLILPLKNQMSMSKKTFNIYFHRKYLINNTPPAGIGGRSNNPYSKTFQGNTRYIKIFQKINKRYYFDSANDTDLTLLYWIGTAENESLGIDDAYFQFNVHVYTKKAVT